LVELIVVLAIILTLSALLFPVFASVKGTSQRVACASNMRQVVAGTLLYANDYDDRFPPINHLPGREGNSRTDRTWVQLMLPYVRNFSVFRCPADGSPRPKAEATYDQDLVPGDTASRYYSASMHANYGYNYHNLAPVVQHGASWVSRPRELATIAQPSMTLLFVDSVWTRRGNGTPYGGGNWLVVPPCRFYSTSEDSFTGATATSAAQVYTKTPGWDVEETQSAEVYGNAWPWHRGRMNVVRIDGSVTTMTPKELTAGCEVRTDWQGDIRDAGAYMWDAR